MCAGTCVIHECVCAGWPIVVENTTETTYRGGKKSQFCTGVTHNEGSEKFSGAQFLVFHLLIACLSSVRRYSPT